jgi:hypothetical protein
MILCCLELFVIVDSLNIVPGILIEEDETCGTLLLDSVNTEIFWDFLTIRPENVSPLNVCG